MFPEMVSVQLDGAGLAVHAAARPAPLHPLNEAPAMGEAFNTTCDPSAKVPETLMEICPPLKPRRGESEMELPVPLKVAPPAWSRHFVGVPVPLPATEFVQAQVTPVSCEGMTSVKATLRPSEERI